MTILKGKPVLIVCHASDEKNFFQFFENYENGDFGSGLGDGLGWTVDTCVKTEVFSSVLVRLIGSQNILRSFFKTFSFLSMMRLEDVGCETKW